MDFGLSSYPKRYKFNNFQSQHIRRYHIKPVQCSTCGFRGDAGQVKEHRGRAKECVKKEFERIGERDLEIEEILKKQPGLCTTKLFDAIFSSCSEHPHQYTKNCNYRIRMKTHRHLY